MSQNVVVGMIVAKTLTVPVVAMQTVHVPLRLSFHNDAKYLLPNYFMNFSPTCSLQKINENKVIMDSKNH